MRKFTIECSGITMHRGVRCYWYQLILDNVVLASGPFWSMVSSLKVYLDNKFE